MKLSPASFIAAAKSGDFHSEMRLTPERLPGPANFHDVRACVSADVAHTMKSHVACFALVGQARR